MMHEPILERGPQCVLQRLGGSFAQSWTYVFSVDVRLGLGSLLKVWPNYFNGAGTIQVYVNVQFLGHDFSMRLWLIDLCLLV